MSRIKYFVGKTTAPPLAKPPEPAGDDAPPTDTMADLAPFAVSDSFAAACCVLMFYDQSVWSHFFGFLKDCRESRGGSFHDA